MKEDKTTGVLYDSKKYWPAWTRVVFKWCHLKV